MYIFYLQIEKNLTTGDHKVAHCLTAFTVNEYKWNRKENFYHLYVNDMDSEW